MAKMNYLNKTNFKSRKFVRSVLETKTSLKEDLLFSLHSEFTQTNDLPFIQPLSVFSFPSSKLKFSLFQGQKLKEFPHSFKVFFQKGFPDKLQIKKKSLRRENTQREKEFSVLGILGTH